MGWNQLLLAFSSLPNSALPGDTLLTKPANGGSIYTMEIGNYYVVKHLPALYSVRNQSLGLSL